jgi:bacillolysin
MRARLLRALGLGCTFSALIVGSAGAATTTSSALFSRDAAGSATLVRAADGAVSTAAGRVTARALGVPPAAHSGTLARAGVDRYAVMLGLRSGTELRQSAVRPDAQGTTVQYQQMAGDVPVYDGRVLVRVDRSALAITSITASVAGAVGTDAGRPAISPDVARAIATNGVPDPDVLAGPRLVAYAGVPFGSRPTTLAFVTDVRSTSQPLRRLVVVDAASGRVIDTLNRLQTAENRAVHDAGGLELQPGRLVRSEGQPPTGDPDADNAYTYTGATYDYYLSTFGRDSYDNAGAPLVSTVHFGMAFDNAFWDGAQMVYGTGFPVIDVTAHELTHAVTDHTAALEYVDQAGALNESISDMAAWDVDPGDTTLGEDLPGGPTRDIRDPGAHGQPATAAQYVCTILDNGGVHINGGIPNKVYANLVDSLGRPAAAQVRYRAQTTYLTPQAGFADARAAFVSAAADVGADPTATAAAWEAQGVTATWTPPCSTARH